MRHGFRYTYGRGCRCDDCRAAERRHKAARRKPANDRLPLSPAIITQLRAADPDFLLRIANGVQ